MKNVKRPRVLHITNWYPNPDNPLEALWIRRQIESIEPFCDNYVVHIQVNPSNRIRLIRSTLPAGFQLILYVPFHRWILVEYLTFYFLRRYLRRLDVNRKFDLINFHIAYPLLTFWQKIAASIKVPVMITEHWSAYHFGFNLHDETKLARVRKIFGHGLPLVVVSKALQHDIEQFSRSNFDCYVIPNVVDIETFRYVPSEGNKRMSFFMISYWKKPKDPFVVIQAFRQFIIEHNLHDAQLRIGGYGPMWNEMLEVVKQLGLENNVEFVGRLQPYQIAKEMREAAAFLHGSSYETFSVVCAEALCCGTPVISSGVGGIREFVGLDNGRLVTENSDNAWKQALTEFWCNKQYDRERISVSAQKQFGKKAVGRRYFEVIQRVYEK